MYIFWLGLEISGFQSLFYSCGSKAVASGVPSYPSTVNIIIILRLYQQMQEDDLMLNIAKPIKVIQATNKKDKYTLKYRLNKQNNKSRSTGGFNYNLLPTPDDPEKAKQQKVKVEEEKENMDGKFKRSRNFEREDNHQQTRNMRGDKRIKREDSGRPVQVHPQLIKPSSVKASMPQEIRPELVALQNKIDVNPLDKYKLHPLLQNSLKSNQITSLTNIQINCYESIFHGKDTIAKASTGSGKTLAYLIPLLNQYIQKKVITQRDAGTVMLIICPSRELCVQGQKQVLRCLKRTPFIVPGCLFGGEQTNHEKNRLRKGVNILFSTPGRLIYHLKNTQSFKLDNLKTLIFEEADRTLDMGFQQDINQILTTLKSKLEANYIQKILVSAHFNEKVQGLIEHLNMDNPKYIGFEKQAQQQENATTQQINISKNLKQQYVLMTQGQRIPLMIAYLQLVKESKVMIFVSTIDQVQYLDYLLNNMKYRDANGKMTEEKVESRRVFKIHGDLDQKYRTNTYLEFRNEKYGIMISTEVASRGLDFPDLNHIILFDVPPTLTDYGNRVGRSARFNSSGVSLLMLHYQESDYAEKIRFYCPQLQVLQKDIIFDGFSNYLSRINIRDNSYHYIEGLVRGMVKDDDEKYTLARKAYVSMLRAYARLKDKHIFAVKKLDLKLLGRCFGINSRGGKEKRFNPKAKESYLEAQRKKRKVENVRALQVSEYL